LAPGGGIAKFDNPTKAKEYIGELPDPYEGDDEEYEDEEEDEGPYTPDSWDTMTNDQQEETENKWKSNSYDEFYNSEVDNWYSNGDAYDTAATQLADDYKDPHADIDWATDAIDEVIDGHSDSTQPIRFTRDQLLKAISLTYDAQGSGYKSPPPDIEFDDDKLVPEGWADMPTLPGIEPQKPSDFLTDDMRRNLEKALSKAFVKKADKDSSSVDPPEYLKDSVDEYQGEYWSQMEDEQKFKYAQDYNVIEDEPPAPKPTTADSGHMAA
jgi:hypothetical protein